MRHKDIIYQIKQETTNQKPKLSQSRNVRQCLFIQICTNS